MGRIANATGAVVLMAIAIVGCQSQQRNGGGGAQPDASGSAKKVIVSWSGSETVEVKDPAEGTKAFSVDVPSGWKFEGTILRPHGCHAPGTPADGLSYGSASPDGLTAMGQMPGVSWDWASDGVTPQKCKAVDITTAAGFLLNIAVPNAHPDAKIIGIVPLPPQMQAGLEAQQRKLASGGGLNGSPMRETIDAARVRVEYEVRGQVVEEQMGTVLTCMESNFPAYPQMRRPARTTRHCGTHGTNFRRAPKGHLDQLLANSLKQPAIDQAWDADISRKMQAQYDRFRAASDKQFEEIQDHFKQQTAAMLKRGQEQQDITKRGTNLAIARDNDTVAAMQKGAHMQVLDSLNRMDFVDPTTGRKIETSNQYTHNWISSDKSEVVLNGDPTFDPNGVVDPIRQSWTELIPVW
jgi:hypothetical protein